MAVISIRCIVEPGSHPSHEKLNELLDAELKAGNEPFKCWSCTGWYVREGRVTGRKHIVCDDVSCQHRRKQWRAGKDVRSERLIQANALEFNKTLLARAILRALEVHWLSMQEIADELGCSLRCVQDVKQHVDEKGRRNAQAHDGGNGIRRNGNSINADVQDRNRGEGNPNEARADAIGPAVQPARPRGVRAQGGRDRAPA